MDKLCIDNKKLKVELKRKEKINGATILINITKSKPNLGGQGRTTCKNYLKRKLSTLQGQHPDIGIESSEILSCPPLVGGEIDTIVTSIRSC